MIRRERLEWLESMGNPSEPADLAVRACAPRRYRGGDVTSSSWLYGIWEREVPPHGSCGGGGGGGDDDDLCLLRP